jgi:hypothetical protein
MWGKHRNIEINARLRWKKKETNPKVPLERLLLWVVVLQSSLELDSLLDRILLVIGIGQEHLDARSRLA